MNAGRGSNEGIYMDKQWPPLRPPSEGIYDFGDGNIAGDRMASGWQCMPCIGVWRGLTPGELRPGIDINTVKRLLEKPLYSPDTRHADNMRENNGVPVFVLNEVKQMYFEWKLKHNSGPPTPSCRLCNNEAWGHAHIFSNKHLEKLLNQPYLWIDTWHPAPSLSDTGVQDP